LTDASFIGTEARLFWPFLIFPPIVYLIGLFGKRLRKKSPETLTATRAKKASKTLIKQCRRPAMHSSDLIQVIRDYLNSRFGLALGSLTANEAADILKSNDVGMDTAEKLRTVVLKLENDVYTGGAQAASDIQQELPAIIGVIEKEVR
jgi:hypothetical protein